MWNVSKYLWAGVDLGDGVKPGEGKGHCQWDREVQSLEQKWGAPEKEIGCRGVQAFGLPGPPINYTNTEDS